MPYVNVKMREIARRNSGRSPLKLSLLPDPVDMNSGPCWQVVGRFASDREPPQGGWPLDRVQTMLMVLSQAEVEQRGGPGHRLNWLVEAVTETKAPQR